MKKTIRLTESDLHNIVKESVRRILMEEVDTGQVKAAWEKEQKPPESPRVKRIRQEIARLRREIDKAEKAGENIKPIQDQIKLLKKQAGFTNVDESRESEMDADWRTVLNEIDRYFRDGIKPQDRVFECRQMKKLIKLNESKLRNMIIDIVEQVIDEKIEIKPENKGKFTATKARTGKSTEELTHSKNPLTRKRAIFAQNAKKWNHKK